MYSGSRGSWVIAGAARAVERSETDNAMYTNTATVSANTTSTAACQCAEGRRARSEDQLGTRVNNNDTWFTNILSAAVTNR